MTPIRPSENNYPARLLIVLVTVVLTVIVFKGFQSHKSQSGSLTNILSSELRPANEYYARFVSNRSAFDKAYNKKLISLYGPVISVNKDLNRCSILIQTGPADYQRIMFSNTDPSNKTWQHDVSEVEVGQEVHIKGFYIAESSTSTLMAFNKCQVVPFK